MRHVEHWLRICVLALLFLFLHTKPTSGSCSVVCGSDKEAVFLLYDACINDRACRHVTGLWEPGWAKISSAELSRTMFAHVALATGIVRSADAPLQNPRHDVFSLVWGDWHANNTAKLCFSQNPALLTGNCSAVDVKAGPSRATTDALVTSMYMLTVYHLYAAPVKSCSNPGERPMINRDTGEVHCICRKDHSCHRDQQDQILLIVVGIFVFAIMAINTFVESVSTTRYMKIWKQKRELGTSAKSKTNTPALRIDV